MVFVIHFYVDWERQTLIGQKIWVHPSPTARENFAIYSFGFNWAINDLTHPDSYAFKRAVILAPLETRTVLADKDLTAEQANRWVRVLIDIEKEIGPYVVCGDTTIVEIPANRTSTSLEYRRAVVLREFGHRWMNLLARHPDRDTEYQDEKEFSLEACTLMTLLVCGAHQERHSWRNGPTARKLKTGVNIEVP